MRSHFLVTSAISIISILILAITTSFAQDKHTVVRVIDGDTVVLETGDRVRLIGVDTPETVHPSKPVEHYGKEASAYTRYPFKQEYMDLFRSLEQKARESGRGLWGRESSVAK